MKQFAIFGNTVILCMTVLFSRVLILLFIALVHSLQWQLWLSWFAIQRIKKKKKAYSA